MSMTAIDIRPGEFAPALAELEALRREMVAAGRVQARLLPGERPPLQTLDYCGRCLPAGSVGGDYFDFIGAGPGQVAMALGDIAGKGMAAALLMASLQAHLRSQYLTSQGDLIRSVEAVNGQFWRSIGSSRYASLFFGRYNDATRRLHYVNCGHLPPILLGADGSVRRLASTGTILGSFPRWDGRSRELTLEPGDILVLFSDGITEAAGEDGEEYGEERLIDLLRAVRRLSSHEICSVVLRSAERFRGGNPGDDRTVVAARAR